MSITLKELLEKNARIRAEREAKAKAEAKTTSVVDKTPIEVEGETEDDETIKDVHYAFVIEKEIPLVRKKKTKKPANREYMVVENNTNTEAEKVEVDGLKIIEEVEEDKKEETSNIEE